MMERAQEMGPETDERELGTESEVMATYIKIEELENHSVARQDILKLKTASVTCSLRLLYIYRI